MALVILVKAVSSLSEGAHFHCIALVERVDNILALFLLDAGLSLVGASVELHAVSVGPVGTKILLASGSGCIVACSGAAVGGGIILPLSANGFGGIEKAQGAVLIAV